MKKYLYLIILSLLLASSISFAVPLPPKPAGPVADFANVIGAKEEQTLTFLAQALWQQAGFALVVATFPSLEDENLEDFTNRLYEHWGIGAKGKDEGVLILLSMNPRKVRIEPGYGSEGYLNDAKCGRILDQYGVPYFRRNDFSSGVLNVAGVITKVVETEKNIQLQAPTRRYGRRSAAEHPQGKPSIFKTLFLIIIFALLMSTRFGRMLLFSMLLSGMLGGRRGGGGFGGGFGGGGFGGGFGGGMSGGGGASRGF